MIRILRRGLQIVSIASALALATSSCTLGGRIGLRDEKDGRAVYAEACASCHGLGGKGDGPAAKALRQRPADLTRLTERSGGTFPRGRVIDVVTGEEAIDAHGDREMPVWNQRFFPPSTGGTATGSIYVQRHLERIIAYLESIQR